MGHERGDRQMVQSVVFSGRLVLCQPGFRRCDGTILAGQSNMEGKGLATHLDTYKEDPQIKPWYGIVKLNRK